MKRSVAVLIRRAPFGRVHVAEGLRAASGVAAGFDAHEVTVLFVDDAVHATLERADWDALDITPHVNALVEAEATLVVDESALVTRGIDPSEVAHGIDIASDTDIGRLLTDADRQMTF